MPRLLLDRATNQLISYPREDNEPVVGLNRNTAYVVEIVREPEPGYDPATHYLQPLEPVIAITDPNSDDVNGTVTYGWKIVELPPVVPLPPNWTGFLAELLQSVSFEASRLGALQIIQSEISTAEGTRRDRLLKASTALNNLGAILLAAGNENYGPGLFIGAWLSLRQAGLIAPEVAIGMAQLATTYNMPPDLIRSLGAPDP
jgi:hypothetical protein